jgi:hypothetical protein
MRLGALVEGIKVYVSGSWIIIFYLAPTQNYYWIDVNTDKTFIKSVFDQTNCIPFQEVKIDSIL